MNRLLKAATAFMCAVGISICASGQMTTITASSIKMKDAIVGSGTVTFIPTNALGQPVAFTAGGSLYDAQGFTGTITNGAIDSGFQVPDECLASPTVANTQLSYQIVVYNTLTKSSLTLSKVTGVCGASWALDHYVPTMSVAVSPSGLMSGTNVPTHCSNASLFYRQTSPSQIYTCVSGTYVLSGSGATLPPTTALLKGDGGGSAVAAAADWDYATPASVNAVSNAAATAQTMANAAVNAAATAQASANAAVPKTSLPNRIETTDLVCEGDSRIAGFGLSSPSTQNPCAILATLSSYSARLGTYANNAVSGSTIYTLYNRYSSVDHSLSPAVTGRRADFLLQIGINDLGGTGVASYVTGTTNLVGGSGYPNGPVSCTITGGGSFPPAGGAVCTAIASNGSVISVTIPPYGGGAGYTNAPTITLGSPGPGGTQATVQATIATMTGAVAISNLQNFISTKLIPDHWTRIIVGTVYPAGAVLANANFRAAWEAYNGGIRELKAGGYADLVVDDASALPDPYDLNVMQLGGLHANITGTIREAMSYNDAIWGQGGRFASAPVNYLGSRSTVTGTFNWRCDPYNINNATTASNNTICGMGTAPTLNANGNTVLGSRSLTVATGGNLITAIGDNVLPLATIPSANTAIGQAAMPSATTASFNTVVGQGAGGICTVCSHSTAVGAGANLGSNVVNAVQLEAGTNNASGTLQFRSTTVIDANGNMPTPVTGPATVPTGSCSVKQWTFSQDGHASFCDGTSWTTKL